MPTVIDSLIVEFGLDPSKFTAGQRQVMDSLKQTRESVEATGKEVESGGGKRVTDFLSNLKKEVLGVAAAYLGATAIKDLIEDVTNADASIGRLSRSLGVNSRDLSAWQGAAVQTGGSVEGVTGTVQALTQASQEFLLTGQGSIVSALNAVNVSLFDAQGNLKTATQLMLDLAQAGEGQDPARFAAFLRLIPGMSQDSINLILQGHDALQRLLQAQQQLGTVSDLDSQRAIQLQRSWGGLERTAQSLGRYLVSGLSPALTMVTDKMQSWLSRFTSWLQSNDTWVNSLDRATGGAISGILGSPNPRAAGVEALRAAFAAHAPVGGRSTPTGLSPEQVEARIRAAAQARGIDPDVAVQVARSEGLYNYTGDAGSSFGPFQLHYGGVAGGGNSVSGLGDVFTRQTGLDARDPSTLDAQIGFVLDWAKTHGWGAWHGFRGLPFAGIGGFPTGAAASSVVNSSSSQSNHQQTTVGTVVVQTQATDAYGISRDLRSAMERSSFAAQANSGQQ